MRGDCERLSSGRVFLAIAVVHLVTGDDRSRRCNSRCDTVRRPID